jgi:hypothetical protein
MLVTSANTVKKYMPNATMIEFSMLESFIDVAEKNEIVPIIGQDLYNILNGASGSGESADYTDLLPYVQRPVVYFALAKSVPIIDVKLTNNGFAITSDGNLAPASKERVAAFRAGVEEAAYDGIESLLAYLYDNKDKYPEYDAGSARDHLINNALEVDEYFNTYRSRRLYLKLEPMIARTETFDIAAQISSGMLADIITKNKANNLGSAYTAIINDLKAATVYLSISYAITSMSSDIQFNKIVRKYIIGKESYSSETQLRQIKEEFHSMGVQHLMKAKAYILDNVDSFTKYKESDLYVAAESDTPPGFQNSSDYNSFTFGGYGG